jgi:hypothetical protein
VLFRTAEGTKLRAAVGRDVAFGADGYDAGAGQVWSVVVKGVTGGFVASQTSSSSI